jgi:RNA-splicing ligase RtcB
MGSMLSDEKKKLLSDLAIGKNVTSEMSDNEQFAALRKQMDNVLASNSKIVVDADYKTLSELVAKEKEKKTTKADSK